MPRFKSIIFDQNSPKIKYFIKNKKKMQNFLTLWAPRQTPMPPAAGGPADPQSIHPPLWISGYAPECKRPSNTR